MTTSRSSTDSLLSITVGDEKLPNMTSESHIEVSRCFRLTRLRLHITDLSDLDSVVSGSALGPAHVRHDGECAGASGRTD